MKVRTPNPLIEGFGSAEGGLKGAGRVMTGRAAKFST